MKKFAIVGCGQVAEKHAAIIKSVGTLKAVCDIDFQTAERFALGYDAVPYQSLDEALAKESELDVIVVCTPNGYHAEHAIKSLQAGKDVLVESPLCLTKAAAWQMIETEKYCGKRSFIVSRPVYNTSLINAKKLLETNDLGNLYSFELSCSSTKLNYPKTRWKGQSFPGGGALYAFFSFYIDAMLWLLGDVEEAKGFKSKLGSHPDLEFEDTGTVSLQMSNGIIGSINWSLNNVKEEATLTIVAKKGTVQISGKRFDIVAVLNQEGRKEIDSHNSEEPYELEELYAHLLEALDKKETKFPGLFDSLRLVDSIEKIYKSIS